jgi:hypothetical protein
MAAMVAVVGDWKFAQCVVGNNVTSALVETVQGLAETN